MIKAILTFSLTVALLLGAVMSLEAHALDVPEAPPLDIPIVDKTDTLSKDQINSLSRQIQKSRLSKSYQLGVLLIPSLDGASLEEYSIKVAREWGIGNDDANNGVLFLIVKDDRLMRIEVGLGLEGDLTDARSRRIVDNAVAPYFKAGKYYQGIQIGISEIHNAVMGRAETGVTTIASDTTGVIQGMLTSAMIFIAFVLTWLASVLGRTRSWWAGGIFGAGVGLVFCLMFGFGVVTILASIFLAIIGLAFDYFVSKNYKKYTEQGKSLPWWTGGNSGGFGGWSSGGGGFGGGSFGGGGASGRW